MRRETDDPAAFELALAGSTLAERDEDTTPAIPTVTGLVSVRA
jgi:hypothetical protein